MKRYYRSTITVLTVAFMVLSAAFRASAADDPSAADAFAASYRKEKKAQHKEKILKVLHPSADQAARSQEFVIRSLYDQSEMVYRQKDYAGSRKNLEELKNQLSQSALPEATRIKWSKKADALYKKIAVQELQQQKAAQKAAQKKQPVKKEKRQIKVKPMTVKVAQQPAAMVPPPDLARQQDILNILKQRKQELQFKRDNIQKEYNQGIEKMYDHAVEQYKAKDYMAAKVVFQDIQQLSPNYKDTKAYLNRLERLVVK